MTTNAAATSMHTRVPSPPQIAATLHVLRAKIWRNPCAWSSRMKRLRRDTGDQGHRFVVERERGRLARPTQRTMHEIFGTGRVQILRHALTARGVLQEQAMTDHHVERLAGMTGLVELGEDASFESRGGRFAGTKVRAVT